MHILLVILLFAVGIILIVKGGDYFVDAASWMAEVSGIPKLIVGATVVSFATTLPELLVSAFAGYQHTMNAYKVAVEQKYRFFSYGDAMFITYNPQAISERP